MPRDASSPVTAPTQSTPVPVHRIEVRPAAGLVDTRARTLLRDAQGRQVAITDASTARVYLVQAELTPGQVERVMSRLLASPVSEVASVGVRQPASGAVVIEVHPLPGVMDPAAQSVRTAVCELLGLEESAVGVSTGSRYDMVGIDRAKAMSLARSLLANPVINQIHDRPWTPASLPQGKAYVPTIRQIPLRHLNDEELVKLSRDAHLFLSLDEIRVVRDRFRELGREPTDVELETIAQTWSEHCVHKTLKSTVRYSTTTTDRGDAAIRALPNAKAEADGTVVVTNLLKSSVAAATFELIASGIDWALSVFKDNSGVIAFDEQYGVCIKVETHNRPSAIEPYGGAATGIGGCIRDVIGTGLGSRPFASTDVFVVAHPDRWVEREGAGGRKPDASMPKTPIEPSLEHLRVDGWTYALPPGVNHPRRTLTEVVAGIRDYGNRMGIPTVSGGVYFDDRHIGNPLVFAGCVGLIPRDLVHGKAKPGDRVVALGGRTGRDGIHGATFSSAEVQSTHADEFAHAVQIGNAIEEKRLLEAILRARDHVRGGVRKPLYNAITDCGAGGFSSAVGEMGSELGAEVHLDRAPLKYEGLTYTEIWISEAQERMILAVPQENFEAFCAICREEHVEVADLGHFGTPGAELVLMYHDLKVAQMPMSFLHDGIPMPERRAVWAIGTNASKSESPAAAVPDAAMLGSLLSHPNIASKHWIVRQYDHEVRAGSAVKPLVGPSRAGPSDASVVAPVEGSRRGVSISCGLQTGIGDPSIGGDPYEMVLAAIDECVRNLVCVGTDPSRIAILDNFCWPGCAADYPNAEQNMGALLRACAGCYDGAKAYRTPFVSGKDSLNNQLRYKDAATGREHLIQIPPTLLITGLGIVSDVRTCVTMDAKRAGNVLVLVGRTQAALGGSHVQQLAGGSLPTALASLPKTDLTLGPATAAAVHGLISAGLVRSAHDVSDGGVLCAVAEMLIAHGSLGAKIDLTAAHADPLVAAFSESPSRYVLEIEAGAKSDVLAKLQAVGAAVLGELNTSGELSWGLDAAPVAALATAWRGPLDW